MFGVNAKPSQKSIFQRHNTTQNLVRQLVPKYDSISGAKQGPRQARGAHGGRHAFQPHDRTVNLGAGQQEAGGRW